MPRPIFTVFLCALCVSVANVLPASAGPLAPPVGPVVPTPGPEPRIAINDATTPGDADSLFHISAPGSYYLTANVLGVAAKSGIEIASNNVTIDLMGFELRGVAGSLNGIIADAPRTNVVVRNGSVSNWGSSGVDLGFPACTGTMIEQIVCTASGSIGIRCGTHGIIRDCNSTFNASSGIIGFDGALVEACAASNNTGTGIACGNATTVMSCSARSNTGAGFTFLGSARITGCTAYQNTLSGFSLGDGSNISGCTATFNTNDGIITTNNCLVLNNNCRSNGSGGTGSGIFVGGSDNRIEGNNCVGADTGVNVTGTGNFIARNTCSGNTNNWNIAGTGNICLVVSATAAAPFSGNAGGAAPGSTDPNANFTY